MAKNQRSESQRHLTSGRVQSSRAILKKLAATTPINESGMRSPQATRRRKRRAATVNSKYTPRWHTSGTGPAEADKVFLSRTEARGLILDQLAAKLSKHHAFYLADEQYYCTPLENAREIIDKSQVDKHNWVEDVMDCDDFALMLKAHFVEAAYKNGLRRPPHCFGIAWGYFGGERHGLNWMVNADRQVRFVEPQTDEIFEPREEDHDIYFLFG